MKRLVVAIALLTSALSAGAQVRNEVQVGTEIPMYTVLNVPLPGDLEKISPGFSVGYKWLHEKWNCAGWYLESGLYNRSLLFNRSVYVSADRRIPLRGQAVNIPIGVGMRFSVPVGENFALYGDFSGGLNVDFGYKNMKSKLLAVNISNGSPIEGNNWLSGEFSLMNTCSDLVNSILNTDLLGGTLSTYFKFELGTMIQKRFVVGLDYANFGLVEAERVYNQEGSINGSSDGYFSSQVRSGATVVLSSLSLRVGYLF